LICEVHDTGQIADPLAGRRLPSPTAVGGFGLWLVNHLCDLVQVRTGPGVASCGFTSAPTTPPVRPARVPGSSAESAGATLASPAAGRQRLGLSRPAGRRVTDPDTLERIRSLVIPPAWTEVWICPIPTAISRQWPGCPRAAPVHLPPPLRVAGTTPSSTGWWLCAGAPGPALRRRRAARLPGRPQPEPVLACAVRLLDEGFSGWERALRQGELQLRLATVLKITSSCRSRRACCSTIRPRAGGAHPVHRRPESSASSRGSRPGAAEGPNFWPSGREGAGWTCGQRTSTTSSGSTQQASSAPRISGRGSHGARRRRPRRLVEVRSERAGTGRSPGRCRRWRTTWATRRRRPPFLHRSQGPRLLPQGTTIDPTLALDHRKGPPCATPSKPQ